MRYATVRTERGLTGARVEGDRTVLLDVDDAVSAYAVAGDAAETGELATAGAHFARVSPSPQHVLCIGLNYRSHIEQLGRPLPAYPTFFAKFASTLTGPRDRLVLPAISEHVQGEVELAVVIGSPARRVTPDEVDDARDLALSLEIDGVAWQTGSTADMVFGPAELVAYCSTFLTLQPGDLILTGTPGTTAAAGDLTPGATMTTAVQDLGAAVNPLVSEEPAA